MQGSESVLALLLSWVTIGILVPGLVGLAVGVLSMNPPEYRIARACFTISAVILLGRVGWWMGFELTTSTTNRVLFGFLISGLIGVAWIESMAWVKRRQIAATPNAKIGVAPGGLKAYIDSIAVGRPAHKPSTTSVVLVVSIVNTGEASIADHWRLKINLGGREFINPRPEVLPESITVATDDGKQITYSGDQALYNVSVKEPIPRGGRIIGLMLYILPINFKEAQKQRGVYTLTFKDVWGIEHVAEDRALDRNVGPLSYPGLTHPPSKPNKNKKRR